MPRPVTDTEAQIDRIIALRERGGIGEKEADQAIDEIIRQHNADVDEFKRSLR